MKFITIQIVVCFVLYYVAVQYGWEMVPTWTWLFYSIPSACERIVELLVNYYLILPLTTYKYPWMGLNVVAALAAMTGRITDTMGGGSSLSIRLGLAMVSIGCLLPAVFAVTTLVLQLRKIASQNR
ncbi:hypothetical protein HK096_010690, partial [Nowakowskiella sp. JEL0078]